MNITKEIKIDVTFNEEGLEIAISNALYSMWRQDKRKFSEISMHEFSEIIPSMMAKEIIDNTDNILSIDTEED